jgi:hypothetical protein
MGFVYIPSVDARLKQTAKQSSGRRVMALTFEHAIEGRVWPVFGCEMAIVVVPTQCRRLVVVDPQGICKQKAGIRQCECCCAQFHSGVNENHSKIQDEKSGSSPFGLVMIDILCSLAKVNHIIGPCPRARYCIVPVNGSEQWFRIKRSQS